MFGVWDNISHPKLVPQIICSLTYTTHLLKYVVYNSNVRRKYRGRVCYFTTQMICSDVQKDISCSDFLHDLVEDVSKYVLP